MLCIKDLNLTDAAVDGVHVDFVLICLVGLEIVKVVAVVFLHLLLFAEDIGTAALVVIWKKHDLEVVLFAGTDAAEESCSNVGALATGMVSNRCSNGWVDLRMSSDEKGHMRLNQVMHEMAGGLTLINLTILTGWTTEI